jgi:predicted HTH transcriptional regulator
MDTNALIYNFKTESPGIGVKSIIAKAICALLNSKGGFLLVGISDNGDVIGLEHDFKSCPPGKKPEDYFRLEFDQMMHHFFDKSILVNVAPRMIPIDGKKIFLVSVTPSNSPAFCKTRLVNGSYEKEFFIRGAASSISLNDPEEILKYCISKWTK